ncbi:hypothetical protein QYE76_008938 [Lolium multiflorum]|uniref:Uncharacterized protein n=1 Tax=Lolium multiflorum TaxID=4521 RepID=A0AAD8TR12_LOLMU|nr:hypothetical protein QYE76_008938 [Lolium multiflorum]
MCNNSSAGGAMATTRKGPWTEQEDAQLVWFVRLLGERRWDFLAQVSGLRRTGKSCRLRWVNYLHPGLKRGRITAEEERLILNLHAQWGSRWSRIARKLPGRTDNEIKNYWRTHMRKMAQEEKTKKKGTAASSPSSSSTSATTCSASATDTTSLATTTTDALQESTSMVDDEEATTSAREEKKEVPLYCAAVEMDQLWNEIAAAEIYPDMMMSWGCSGQVAVPVVEPTSPAWEFCADYSLWRIDDEEYYNNSINTL